MTHRNLDAIESLAHRYLVEAMPPITDAVWTVLAGLEGLPLDAVEARLDELPERVRCSVRRHLGNIAVL